MARKAALASIGFQQKATWYWQGFNSRHPMPRKQYDRLLTDAAIQAEIAQHDYENMR